MFIVKKNISGGEYFYIRESVREGGKVKSKTLGYAGKTLEEANKKLIEMKNEKNLSAEKHKNNKNEENSGEGMVEEQSEDAGSVKKDIENFEKSKKISQNSLRMTLKSEENGNDSKSSITIEDLTQFCKRKGFVYPSGEIYGGLAGFWDFGHLGVELKNNIKKEWWKFHVHSREEVVGIDGAIITNTKVWEASGHVKSFVEIVIKDKKTKELFKVDVHESGKYKDTDKYSIEGTFNPMFTTTVGPNLSSQTQAFLRPETAQLIFTNFKAVQDNARLKLPFGIAQIGKAFRNEVSPREFIFRNREFEQMELEYFTAPKQKCPYIDEIKGIEIQLLTETMQKKNQKPKKMEIFDAHKKGLIKSDWHAYFLALELSLFLSLGANPEKFRARQHKKEELSHYSSDTWDLEYEFPMGWRELQGFADRSNYDLKQHEQYSK